jgi:hypothetical protein
MAAPQTHFVITWVIFRFFTWILGVSFSAWETFSMFFWGVLIDFDHFLFPEFVKDLIKIRIPNLLHGKGGEPSIKKIFPSWLHYWPGFLISIVWGLYSTKVNPAFRFYLPTVFYILHYWGIDRWQVSMPGMEPYKSWWHPFVKKGRIRKVGYPVKSRIEVLVATALMGIIILFELFRIVF